MHFLWFTNSQLWRSCIVFYVWRWKLMDSWWNGFKFAFYITCIPRSILVFNPGFISRQVNHRYFLLSLWKYAKCLSAGASGTWTHIRCAEITEILFLFSYLFFPLSHICHEFVSKNSGFNIVLPAWLRKLQCYIFKTIVCMFLTRINKKIKDVQSNLRIQP